MNIQLTLHIEKDITMKEVKYDLKKTGQNNKTYYVNQLFNWNKCQKIYSALSASIELNIKATYIGS